jgi:hypothetical protein
MRSDFVAQGNYFARRNASSAIEEQGFHHAPTVNISQFQADKVLKNRTPREIKTL